MSAGDHLHAIQACRHAIRYAPFRDSSHRLLVEAYCAEGNPSAALSHILGYRRNAEEELGMIPDRVLPDLYRELSG